MSAACGWAWKTSGSFTPTSRLSASFIRWSARGFCASDWLSCVATDGMDWQRSTSAITSRSTQRRISIAAPARSGTAKRWVPSQTSFHIFFIQLFATSYTPSKQTFTSSFAFKLILPLLLCSVESEKMKNIFELDVCWQTFKNSDMQAGDWRMKIYFSSSLFSQFEKKPKEHGKVEMKNLLLAVILLWPHSTLSCFLIIQTENWFDWNRFVFSFSHQLFSFHGFVLTWKQLACLSGSNGQQQKAQGGYVRHILAGSPKRSHFSSSRRQVGNGHVSEISSTASGVNGTAKKRVSCTISLLIDQSFHFLLSSQRRRKGNKLKFHRPKIHAPHRRPCLLRRIIQQQKLLG